jgi:CubicO group peptidase (beta-lactamase class C family)
MDIQTYGFCDPAFENVRTVFNELLSSGTDLGSSFCATWKGQIVVDIWGGHLDEDRQQEWQEDSLVNVFSTTKTMSFLCALLLADRGELDFNAPVSRYWPEFAANGKSGVLTWHLMNHAAGLSGMDEMMTAEDIYDWDKVTQALANQAPWWEPGTASGYHALTQGYLIGEVVKRITGVSLGRFFDEQIATPMQADFYIGVPESEFSRIGNLIPPPDSNALGSEAADDSIAAKTFRSPSISALDSQTDAWRRAEIPAANGHGNARSVAKIHTLLANDGNSNGQQIISAETCRSIMQPRIQGMDLVFGTPMAFGLGFGLIPAEKNTRNLCFWGGWGGSRAIIDQDNQLSFSYVMNKMASGLLGDDRGDQLTQAVFASLPN